MPAGAAAPEVFPPLTAIPSALGKFVTVLDVIVARVRQATVAGVPDRLNVMPPPLLVVALGVLETALFATVAPVIVPARLATSRPPP